MTDLMPVQVPELIECIIFHLPEGEKQLLLAQARSARMLAEISGRMLDLVVDPGAPLSSIPDGPVRPIPSVMGQSDSPWES